MKNKSKTSYREIVGSTSVSVENKQTKEKRTMKEEDEYLPTDPIDQDAAFVSVKGGATVKLHGYNMGRIDVSLMYPCYPSQVNEVYEKVKNWVDKRVEAEVSQLRENIPESKSVDV